MNIILSSFDCLPSTVQFQWVFENNEFYSVATHDRHQRARFMMMYLHTKHPFHILTLTSSSSLFHSSLVPFQVSRMESEGLVDKKATEILLLFSECRTWTPAIMIPWSKYTEEICTSLTSTRYFRPRRLTIEGLPETQKAVAKCFQGRLLLPSN